MANDFSSSRRKFLQQLTASSAALAASPFATLGEQEKIEERERRMPFLEEPEADVDHRRADEQGKTQDRRDRAGGARP